MVFAVQADAFAAVVRHVATAGTLRTRTRAHEVVICTAGELTLVQEIDGREVRTTLRPGEYVINPPGVWDTADVTGRATVVFITAGAGTQGRPRGA